MALTQLAPPYPVFTDKNGDPLDNGYLYFGEVNKNPETNPIQVYYDSAFTQPAAQPLRTSNGYVMRNGSPALVYASSQFSVTVRDKNNALVIYSPVGYGIDPGSISGTVVYDDFTGDGSTVNFTLSASPSTKNATNVYIDGVYQSKDNYSTSGSTLSFSTAPPLNSAIEVVTQESSIIGGASSQQITYIQGGAGSVTRTVQSRLRDFVSVKDFGVSESNTASQNYDILQGIIRNAGGHRKLIYWPNGTYQLDVFNPNNCVIIGDDVTLQFTNNPAKSVVMGQITDCHISGFTFQSLEVDLENQRCTADKSTLEDCKFIGWRNPTNSNAWGLYFKGQKNCRVISCGFQDNTQSDIAVVDTGNGIVIENCYAIDPIGSPFHINCEPNGSSQYNNVSIRACTLGQLSLLENGTGGTSNQSITVENCEIETLFWDGASAVIESCRINNIIKGSEIYAGSLYGSNSLGLGINLIPDPYMLLNAFNQSQAISNNQIWYMRSRSGSVTGGGRTLEDDDGLRYFRFNGAGQNGTISYSLATDISTVAGKTYCVAITGRRFSGTTADYLAILDGGTTINCRFFRQSNNGNDEFVTEVVFFEAVNTALNFIVRNSVSNSTNGFDLKSITVHEVVFDGYNFDETLQRYHRQFGPRNTVVGTLPTSNPADQTGLQTGDQVIVNGDKTYAWDGTTLQALW